MQSQRQSAGVIMSWFNCTRVSVAPFKDAHMLALRNRQSQHTPCTTNGSLARNDSARRIDCVRCSSITHIIMKWFFLEIVMSPRLQRSVRSLPSCITSTPLRTDHKYQETGMTQVPDFFPWLVQKMLFYIIAAACNYLVIRGPIEITRNQLYRVWGYDLSYWKPGSWLIALRAILRRASNAHEWEGYTWAAIYGVEAVVGRLENMHLGRSLIVTEWKPSLTKGSWC